MYLPFTFVAFRMNILLILRSGGSLQSSFSSQVPDNFHLFFHSTAPAMMFYRNFSLCTFKKNKNFVSYNLMKIIAIDGKHTHRERERSSRHVHSFADGFWHIFFQFLYICYAFRLHHHHHYHHHKHQHHHLLLSFVSTPILDLYKH